MEINKLLLEGYIVFGIICTYTLIFILGVLTGERNIEREKENVQQIQSKKEKSINGTKLTFME